MQPEASCMPAYQRDQSRPFAFVVRIIRMA
jgi:hypothetical protein